LGNLHGESRVGFPKEIMVLVDFYNLKLNLSKISEPNWRTPEADRPKIMAFLAKHAPEVLKYRTAAEIEALPKPVEASEFVGTLGAYEKVYGKSWFESEDARQFQWDYLRIRNLIDSYIAEKKSPKGPLLLLVSDFAKAFTPRLFVGNNETKEAVSLAMFPLEEIDFTRHIILRGQGVSGRWDLATSKIVVALYDELVGWLEGEIQLWRCEASDCNRIFHPAPQGSEQRFCSARCRNRMAKKRARKKSPLKSGAK
jgi:hypothetical protein